MGKNIIKKLSIELLQVAIIVLFFYFFLFPVNITGDSMESTLFNGDKVLASRIWAEFGMYDTDDIVIIKSEDNEKKIRIIKRIAATEGDSITVKDGVLYINDVCQEGYFSDNILLDNYILKEGEIFVLGDNPSKSTDSRHLGLFSKDDIESKVIVRIYPLDSIKRI